MTDTIFKNAMLLDAENGTLIGPCNLLVEDGVVAYISTAAIRRKNAASYDMAGKVLMPGLCDAHVHVTATASDPTAMRLWSPSYATARAIDVLDGMLMRGFTTVRDAGGADYGLAQAVDEGHIAGPRILFCGKALTQTGGHGDTRDPLELPPRQNEFRPGTARTVDGVTEARLAAREEIRRGASHIKIMASGGLTPPSDRLGNLQFSLEEIAAIVDEADAAGLYVMAHAYTADAVERVLECGVRSVEHGSLMNRRSVDLFKKAGAFLVPTLVGHYALADHGLESGLSAEALGRIAEVIAAGKTALEMADKHGVKIAYGTDLRGGMHHRQSEEFTLRAQVQTSRAVIRSATTVAAELFGLQGQIGVLEEGARADILAIDGNPFEDLTLLQHQGRHMRAIMKDGVFYKNELEPQD